MKAKAISNWGYCSSGNYLIKDGDIVEADLNYIESGARVLKESYGPCVLCEYKGVKTYIPAMYLLFQDKKEIDWEERRYELVKEITRSCTPGNSYRPEDIVKMADEIITGLQKLKKEDETKIK